MNSKAKIAEKLGRIFEIGFNIGILAYIDSNQFQHNYGESYRRDLERLTLPTIVKRIAREEEQKITSPESIKHLEKWCQFFIQKGFLAGLNFFGEYISSTGWNQSKLSKPVEILYFQCNFSGDNSFGSLPLNKTEVFNGLLSQLVNSDRSNSFTADFLNSNLNRYLNQYYEKKGEFFQADTLILLRRDRQLRIICVDLSVFSVRSAEDLLPLDNIETLRRILMREVKHIRSKSFFSKLRIDTGNTEKVGGEFSPDLKRYFTAFKREDKEYTKLIQAGAYAYSFYEFLRRETGIITEKSQIIFNVVGYSDRNLSTISLQPENIEVLATCSEIYKRELKDQDIKTARREVLELIQINAAKSFENGKKLVADLSAKSLELGGNSVAKVIHQERIEGFVNSVGIIEDDLAAELNISPGSTLRNAHAELIKKALLGDEPFVFLTGNPGIGKTTAIANFLKSHIDEGFLLFYVSPRKQVNIDLIEKFRDETTGEFAGENLFCINTNSILIAENGNRPTLQYYSRRRCDSFQENNVSFIPATESFQSEKEKPHRQRLHRETQETIKDKGKKTVGVLYSICRGIFAAIDKGISNNIVATVSTQSLKVTRDGSNTLKHLQEIFKGAYNPKRGVIPEKMQEISGKIKHIFLAIDEITGDDSGVDFLHGFRKFLIDYQLTNPAYGFNTKIIVADASIVEQEVIKQHLSQTSPEPDKIYFRLAKGDGQPLSVEKFEFRRKGAIAINANSYPASSLNITYKLFIERSQFNEDRWKYSDNQLVKAVQSNITEDINRLLNNPEAGQVLVYIQDKRRLQELIEKLGKQRQRGFEKNRDFLEINANLSEADKKTIQQYKQKVKVVFMTSSASRGLSFPKAKHILVEIPRFQIERNLMEAIQVIYRARGEYWEDGEKKTLDDGEKEIIFYLGDRAVYYSDNDAEEQKISIEESVLNLLDMLLILKLSIMTRIRGAGRLGKKEFMMIPIGGKSVSAAGNTFTDEMTNLIRGLKNEHHRRPEKKVLKDIYESLEKIFSRGDFALFGSVGNEVSYLSLWQSFNKEFPQLCNRLDKLLDFGNIEIGHLSGSLLVVPIKNQRLEETYEMGLSEQIQKYANQELFNQMWAISKSDDYPENLAFAVKGGAMELIKLLKGDRGEIDRSQWFEQNSQNLDRYYAVPLFIFFCGKVMEEYFKQELDEDEETEFRTLLSRYVHSLYPAYNTLPIGRKYREFPFVVFRSYSLEQMRENIFSDRYLLTSNELNVLNLILCRKVDD